MKNWKKLSAVTLLGLVVAGGAGTAIIQLNDSGERVAIEKVAPLSDSEQQAFLDNLLETVSAGAKPSEVEKKLATKIEGLNEDNASEAVYLLLSSLSVEQGTQISKYRVVSDGVVEAYNQGEFKGGAGETFNGVTDKAVQGFLQELSRQHLLIEDDGQGLYLSQHLEYVKKNYESYMNEPLKGVLEVRLKNQNDPYADETFAALDLTKALERVLLIEGMKDEWAGTIYASEMMALQEQAYLDFFGITHDAHFEEKDGKLVMKESVKEEMYLLQAEYANSMMGKDIIGFMDELETDKFERKDSQTFIYERVQALFAEEAEQPPLTMSREGDAE